MRRRIILLLSALLVMLAACGTGSKPTFGHVAIIIMENKEASSVEKAPYFHTLMQQYGAATNYTAVTHPSLPNYLALTGGTTAGLDGSDCSVGATCHIAGTGTNIADSLEQKGLTWKAYMESMPEPCVTKNVQHYAVRHNPFVYYDDIRENQERCAAHDVPFQQLQADLEFDLLPNFIWITPDLCSDMHDQCGKGSQIVTGDAWLQTWVPKLLAAKQFQDGILFITFDEGTSKAACCGAPGGGKILTLVVPGTGLDQHASRTSDVAYNHYSLLRTIEDVWHLPYLNHSGDENVPSMAAFLKELTAQ